MKCYGCDKVLENGSWAHNGKHYHFWCRDKIKIEQESECFIVSTPKSKTGFFAEYMRGKKNG